VRTIKSPHRTSKRAASEKGSSKAAPLSWPWLRLPNSPRSALRKPRVAWVQYWLTRQSPLVSKGHARPESSVGGEPYRRKERRTNHHRTKICVHITTRIWQGVQGAHHPPERDGIGMERTLFPGILWSLIWVFERERRTTFSGFSRYQSRRELIRSSLRRSWRHDERCRIIMLSCSVCLGLTELASFSIATFCLSSNRPLAFRGGSDDLGIPYERSTPTLTLSVSRGT
jgi:hypothetical protein